MKKILILGAGSWGTALASLWATDSHSITLWGHDEERVGKVQKTRENADYLPGISLPENIEATHSLAAVSDAEIIVFVTPSVALREIATKVNAAGVSQNAVFLSCTKGIEHGSGRRMSEILREIFPAHRVAVLSGPNLAVEVARGLPTATVIGCEDHDVATDLQSVLGSERFRIYTSDEVTGIELGGALKNVFAIPAGVSDGFGLGDNSKSALVTRSLAELLRLGTAMGGNPRTFSGLSGAGDLIATCFSKYSRNRGLGERLGNGEPLEKILAETKSVAEGVPTTKGAYEWARRLDVETPIIDLVYAVLYEKKPLLLAFKELLSRDQKAERL
ncbi:MAG: NAD(P)-dependent glycerol-3-phosphate dehydrogenase [Verrucomicrobiota bacterium]|nr:NAD(P)-dependent glycerol-3-phosphate dehydrogenase [Verrucomicrobiota bacterium]